MTPILEYIMSGTEPSDPRKAKIVRRRTSSYSVINRVLYKRSFTVPLLKCIEGGNKLTMFLLRYTKESVDNIWVEDRWPGKSSEPDIIGPLLKSMLRIM